MNHMVQLILLSLITANAYASDFPDFPFVYAHGKAKIEVAPDIATISFHIEEFAEDATKAETVVRDRSLEVLAFLAGQNVDKSDIVAYEIDKRAVRELKDYEELNIIGYEINRRIEVTLRDLKKYETVAKQLLSLSNVTNLDTNFNRTDRKQLEGELVAKACADAREQAGQMAQGFGVRLGPVYAISRSGFQNMASQFGVGMDEVRYQATDRSVPEEEVLFVPATIELSTSVSVIFMFTPE